MRRFVPGLASFAAACAARVPAVTSPSVVRAAELSVIGSEGNVPSVFVTQLRAESEMAPATQTSRARGREQVTVNEDGTAAFQLVVRNVGDEDFILAHVHEHVAGQNMRVRIDFALGAHDSVDERSAKQIVARGVAVVLDPGAIQRQLNNTERFHVDLHTTTRTAGAISAQLR